MHQKLPKEIDPFRFAQNGLKLEGQLPLVGMPRLIKSLQRDEGLVNINMAFDIDEIGTPYMHGVFKASVTTICERCMKPMVLDVHVDCLLALLASELKVEGLAEQYEPWVVESSDPVSLSAVIEDELILALPLVPRHVEACLPKEAWIAKGNEIEIGDSDKPVSPFAVLSSLKTK